MALIDIDAFQPFPDANGYSATGTQLRVWYSRSFVDSDGVSVQGGNGVTGFYVAATCIVTTVVSIPSFAVRTTLDANDPAPQSIQVYARLFSNNQPKAWIFAGDGAPNGWVIPNPDPLTSMTYEELALYNQATVLANPPQTFWTAAQVQAYFDALSPASDASDVTKGITKLSVAPVSATDPIALGPNDPTVVFGSIGSSGVVPRSDGVNSLTASQIADNGVNVGVQTLNYFQAGDFNFVQNGTYMGVNDNLGVARFFAGGNAQAEYAGMAAQCTGTDPGKVYVQATGYSYVYGSAGIVILGDGEAANNSTQVVVDDTTQTVTVNGTLAIDTPFTLGGVSVTPTGTELNYVDGVTSAIQTQLNAKAPLASPTFTGHITTEGVTATGATGTGKFVYDASPALTGTPTGPTAAVDTSTTQLATTAYVVNQGYAKLVSPSFTTPTLGAASATSVAASSFLKVNNTGKLEIAPKTNDVYGASMTIDVSISHHVIAAVNSTSAACTMTPSAAGTAGDVLIIATETNASGTVTTTFASTFHSSGTQATTASHFSTIVFISDGTRWLEVCRTTDLA